VVKTLLGLGIRTEMRRQDVYGYRAVQAGVAGTIEFALAAGADRFFHKPPDMDRVLEGLREYYPAPSLHNKPAIAWRVPAGAKRG
jgi:hypothetical protein